MEGQGRGKGEGGGGEAGKVWGGEGGRVLNPKDSRHNCYTTDTTKDRHRELLI